MSLFRHLSPLDFSLPLASSLTSSSVEETGAVDETSNLNDDDKDIEDLFMDIVNGIDTIEELKQLADDGNG